MCKGVALVIDTHPLAVATTFAKEHCRHEGRWATSPALMARTDGPD
jgi:hypothetical protein